MGRTRSEQRASARSGEAGRRHMRGGFTLIDVLVSISVVAVLIGLMLPSLSMAAESARRVACRSNVRQIGLGIAMYAEDNNQFLPTSIFVAASGPSGRFVVNGAKLQSLRASIEQTSQDVTMWDGLGLLYSKEYLSAGKVFYCPSHRGRNPFRVYAGQWAGLPGEIIGNFHFRGVDPNGASRLDLIEPRDTAIVSDGLASPQDFNHVSGSNVLRADLASGWVADPSGLILDTLGRAPGNNMLIQKAWNYIDEAAADEPLSQ